MALPKNRILCIDDSVDNCELVKFVLSEAGYEVELAYSLTDSLGLIQTIPFHVCLVDIHLPDGSGYELISQIRSTGQKMPIIVCSGDTRDQTRELIMEAGAIAFLTKPIDFDLLLETIAQLPNSIASNSN